MDGYTLVKLPLTWILYRPNKTVVAIARIHENEIEYTATVRTETDWKAIEHYFAALF